MQYDDDDDDVGNGIARDGIKQVAKLEVEQFLNAILPFVT